MKKVAAFLALALLLTGCATVQESKSLQGELAARGLLVTRGLPNPLPDGSAAIPGTQYIVVSAGSTAAQLADMLNPIPFVGNLAEDEMRRREVRGYSSRYSHVDPFAIAQARMASSSLAAKQAGSLPLQPLVYIMEGSDGRWRLSLVFRVEAPSSVARFMYHLPTTYSSEEMKSTAASSIETLRHELESGSDVLRQLMERDARGQLEGKGTQVEFGSYYIVGRDVAGLVPARMVHFAKAELVEEDTDHVVLRSGGDLHAAAANGALAYGVHYFRKDQMNDFKTNP